ncbi:glutamine--fructose-6-phosphate aminotransferase [isomerizing] [Mycobacterium sp. PO1]|nr:glutamine--fructose-6-phosphate aminotransferase [Mycobacterium sp. PO1]BBA72701.1 glutamine-fructose-6-phosphate aminotransferase [Mycobacterium sp. PO2]GFM18700.1 glutamine--fructose-6-phosphate aminotransferase [isomerizing] [Mycobacterium sp. PO1]GFM26904.1 glutamine--fructose-6-phosphate aminotransferase [isomerizing] [Mycobacterium sp. PO2]
MDHGIDIAAGAEHFAVQWQLVRRLVTVVEFSWGALFTVQRDHPDVFCTGERESSLVRTTTSDQQSIFVDAQADVAEDAWRQTARRQDATGQRDGVSFSV